MDKQLWKILLKKNHRRKYTSLRAILKKEPKWKNATT